MNNTRHTHSHTYVGFKLWRRPCMVDPPCSWERQGATKAPQGVASLLLTGDPGNSLAAPFSWVWDRDKDCIYLTWKLIHLYRAGGKYVHLYPQAATCKHRQTWLHHARQGGTADTCLYTWMLGTILPVASCYQPILPALVPVCEDTHSAVIADYRVQ